MSTPANHHGFTLLETLVALVVVTVGLLGMLGLQAVAIGNTQVSRSQMLARIAAADLADRIRANRLPEASRHYAAIAGDAATPSADCSQTGCTPEQMAQYDAWEWQQSLATTLPGGKGRARCRAPASPTPAMPCQVYAITIVWRGREAGAVGPDLCAGAGAGSLADGAWRCYSIEVRP